MFTLEWEFSGVEGYEGWGGRITGKLSDLDLAFYEDENL